MMAESPRQSRDEICVIPASKLHGMDFWCSCPAWLYGEAYRRETSVSAAGSGETIRRRLRQRPPAAVGKRPLF